MVFAAKTFDELTAAEVYEILKARAQIFMVEQNIRCLDMDDVDYRSLHCFFREDGHVTAYLRAYHPEGGGETVKIGRVLTVTHGVGNGKALMAESIRAIREKMKCRRLRVHAQTYAKAFYEKCGFTAVSGEFLEENIPHVVMERAL